MQMMGALSCLRCRREAELQHRYCASCGLALSGPQDLARVVAVRRVLRLHFLVLAALSCVRVYLLLQFLPELAKSEAGVEAISRFESAFNWESFEHARRIWLAEAPIVFWGCVCLVALTLVALWDFSARAFAWSVILFQVECVLVAIDPLVLAPAMNLRPLLLLWSFFALWRIAGWNTLRRAHPDLSLWSSQGLSRA